jgi:hypothetical protein
MISTDPEFHQRRKDFKPRGFEHKLDNDGRIGENSSILITILRAFRALCEGVVRVTDPNDREIFVSGGS